MNQAIFHKLHVKNGMQYLICNAPNDFPIPEGCFPMETKLDYLHLFCENKAMLHHLMEEVTRYDLHSCLFWISYPKTTSAMYQDLHRDSLWKLLVPYGFHPVALVAFDDTWSCMRVKVNEDGVNYRHK